MSLTVVVQQPPIKRAPAWYQPEAALAKVKSPVGLVQVLVWGSYLAPELG